MRCWPLLLLTLAFVGAPAAAAAPPPAEVDALRRMVLDQQAQIEALTARLTAIEGRTTAAAVVEGPAVTLFPAPLAAKSAAAKPADDTVVTRFRGAPEFSTADGWRFKVRGRINYDAVYIENPGDLIPTSDLGFSTRFRRVRLGVEGEMPGGFGYKAELDFADALARAVDVVLIWRAHTATGRSPIEITLGHIEPLNGFEQISSSRYTSFIERSAFNTAFGNYRRLGVYATYIALDDSVRISAGAFNDTVNADRANSDLLLSSRIVWMPLIGDNQLHFGGSIQYRRYQKNNLAVDYRVQPFSANTATRFVDTGNLAVRDDLVIGAEFVGIFGPFHVAAEAQRLQAHTLRPLESLGTGEASSGSRTAGNPGFFGMHAEAGWMLTGETRGYKDGLWVRTRVRNPLGRGGSGAWSVNVRYDWLDLSDRVGDPSSNDPVNLVDGGRQSGYLAALVWQPMDYVRFTLEYAYGVVTGGPYQSVVNPLGTGPLSERKFDFNVSALRAAWDF